MSRVFGISVYCKNSFRASIVIIFLRMRVAVTSLLRDKLPPFKRVFHFVFLQSLYISFINRNRVLLYICVYGFISDTFILYYWIYVISMCISLLYLHSHFVPKIIRISGIRACCSWSFFSACPQWGLSIASWVSSLSLLRTITLAHLRNPQWWKKRKWWSRRSYQSVAWASSHTT